ncbi:hypothetical protein [Candidatus Planktophila lacus]|uniref:Uncharacterized protein n=1 Tax=Candidatus Planktophila lacus TaxID=1884913 RepID=A0AAC9YPM4_9ACTN|nr:hypothetical protein [Candidatus Planktophila lacus]ASY10051.1 hypothetical protein A1s21148_00435 [Candidatus Planktophila lacus]
MAKQIKSKKSIVELAKSDRKLNKYLIVFPAIALLIKLIVIFNIQAGGWAGADGENYLAGVDGLLNQGFFSTQEKLTYWPAGYPILIWPFAAISLTKFLYMLSIVQSLFFAYSTYFLSKAIQKSTLSYLAFTASLLISFNPTLALGSLAIGYETPVASCMMMALGLAIKSLTKPDEDNKSLRIAAFIGLWFGLASFVQPRFLLVGVVFLLIHTFYLYGKKLNVKFIAVGAIAIVLLPALLVFRNAQAVDKATISTNLGVTMYLGVGEDTLGGYNRIGPGIACEPKTPGAEVSENELVLCIVKWYLSNPSKTVKLAFNKSLYFWSPWSGPVAEGTMARNPWLKISPVQNMQKSVDGANLVRGGFGKFISYSWLVGQLALLVWGFFSLKRRGKFEMQVAVLALTPIALAWLITLGTIGDHRFRIPTMSLSILLQVAGILAIRQRITKAL